MKKLSAVWVVVLFVALLPSTAFSQAQYLIDGVNPLTLSLETIPPNNCQTVTITLDPGGEITSPIFSSGGCWITWDTSQVAVASVVAAESYGSELWGPWDPGFTGLVPEPGGPGTYMVTVGMLTTVPIDQGPIPLCNVEFCCEGPGQSQISVTTIPGFDTWGSYIEPSGWFLWDPYIDQGIINLTQVIPQTDSDDDGILDHEDNCPNYYNPFQEDTYPPQTNGCGDACECKGNFDDDEDQDGSDAATFKTDFGRSIHANPCTNSISCNGDFDCDEDVDGADAAKFKEDFGRSQHSNPCPICPTDPWCVYPVRYAIDFLEAENPGGWTSSLKTFDEAWSMPILSEVEVDVWLNDCPEDLLTAGFSMEYDPNIIEILSIEAYDSSSLPGPWDSSATTIMPDYDGLGTYGVLVLDWATVSADGDDDIIIAKVRLRRTAAPMANITFRTVSRHDTVVDEFGTVYDSEIDSKTVTVGP